MRERKIARKWLSFGIVLVLVAVVFAVVPVPVSAGGGAEPSSTWIVEDGFRLEGGWPHCSDIVQLPDGTYRMYYADASPSGSYPIVIRSAISSDGLTWTRETGIRIGQGYGGQEGWAGTPETIILPDGTYRMYYLEERWPFVGPLWGRISSALSTDGLTWTKEAGIRVDYGGTYDPVMATSPNIIELPNGTYRMYYSGRNEYANHRILSAISSDGIEWIKEPGVRNDIGGIHDSYRADHPRVIRVPDGRYIMFYAGFDNVWSSRILSAVSWDGLTWTKESGIRISPEGLEGGPYSYVSPGDIIKTSDSQYRMYFSADREPWVSVDRLRILSAIGTIPLISPRDLKMDAIDDLETAKIDNHLIKCPEGLISYWKFDEGSGDIAYDSSGNNNYGIIYGTPWTDPTLAIDHGVVPDASYYAYHPSVIKDGSTYKMWWNTHDGTNNAIYYSTSNDGVSWTGHTLAIDHGVVSDAKNYAYSPSVIKDGSTYKMWWTAYDGTNEHIYYSTSTDGINWGSHTLAIDHGVIPDASIMTGRSSVIKDGDIYKMWWGASSSGTNMRIYYSTSTDGISWSGHMLAIDHGVVPDASVQSSFPSVIKNGDIYHMWWGAYDNAHWRIYYSTSTDGIKWTGHNLAIDYGDVPDASDWAFCPSVIKDGDTYKMWLSSGYEDGSKCAIYYSINEGAQWVDGISGKALDFDGDDDYVGDIGTVSTFSFMHNTGIFTLEAWIKLTDYSSDDYYVILGSTTGSAQKGFSFVYDNRIGITDNQLLLAINNGISGDAIIISSSSVDSITDNEWHHVAAMGDGSNVIFYIDGVPDPGSGIMEPKASGDASDVLNIARSPHHSAPYHYEGIIDEVKIWNRALSPCEIKNNYEKINTVGYWKFNEGSGNIAYDSSGNNNYGTIRGTPWTDHTLAIDHGVVPDASYYAYHPSVIKDGSTYKMWWNAHDGTNNAIYYSTSNDGVSWNGHTLAIDHGVVSDASNYAYSPSVIKDGSTYKMWWTAWDGTNGRTYYSTSADGITWGGHTLAIDYGVVPDASVQAVEPSVIKDGATYKMWWGAGDSTNVHIYYSTSTDGISWSGHTLAIDIGVVPDASTQASIPSVIKSGDIYKMWWGAYNSAHWRIYYSTSTDGINWTGHNLAIDYGDVPDTSDHAFCPSVIEDGDTYKMWLSSGYEDGSKCAIYYSINEGAQWVDGIVGNALDFDGDDDYIGPIGTTSTFSFIQNTGVFTIEAWIKLDDYTADNYFAIVANEGGSLYKGFFFIYDNNQGFYDNQLRLALFKGSSGNTVINSESSVDIITDNDWHHVAVTGDASNIVFYVNGVPDLGSGTMGSKSSGDSTDLLNIGRTPHPGSHVYFKGSIDEVAIWDSVLTPEEIEHHYNNGLEGEGYCKKFIAQQIIEREIDKVIGHIEQSLETDLWIDENHLDPQHGHNVFNEEKKAVKKLMKLIDNYDILQNVKDVCQLTINKLVTSDKFLAETALKDALNTDIQNPDNQEKYDTEIEMAEEELLKAEEKVVIGDFDIAIDHYKKAWEHGQNAIKHGIM
jgi:predicted GH43/DUF377 family glycosyl hydrolase